MRKSKPRPNKIESKTIKILIFSKIINLIYYLVENNKNFNGIKMK